MATDDNKKKLLNPIISPYNSDQEGESGEGGEGGEGGQSGHIQFTDFLLPKTDVLLPDEKRRLLSVHNNLVEANVKKQKAKRDHYKALKEQKISPAQHRAEFGVDAQGNSYPQHPILSKAAQFSGFDTQVSTLPNESVADTNEVNRNEAKNRYQLQYAPGMEPKFNPKPQFR